MKLSYNLYNVLCLLCMNTFIQKKSISLQFSSYYGKKYNEVPFPFLFLITFLLLYIKT